MSGVAARSPERQPSLRPARSRPQERPSLVAVPRPRRRAARVPFVSLVGLLLLGGVVGLLLFNTSMQQASFATTALEQQAATLAARQQTLQVELDELRSPQRVAEQARSMGMVLPAAPTFLDLRSGRVVGQGDGAQRPLDVRLQPRPPAKPAVLAPAPRVVEVPAPAPPRPARPTGSTRSGAPGESSATEGVRRDRIGGEQRRQEGDPR